MNKERILRYLIDSMLLVLFFGLLFAPISFIGLSGYSDGDTKQVLGVSSSSVSSDKSDDANRKSSYPTTRSYVVRVMEMNANKESSESTQIVGEDTLETDSLDLEEIEVVQEPQEEFVPDNTVTELP